MRPRSILPPTIGLLIFLLAAPAFGEDQDAAVRLAGEASEAFQRGEYVTAAEKFAEAHDNYPDHSLKMNEMVSWYKARRCEEALVIARETTTSDKPLTERDHIDIGKVNTECGVDEAQAMFDAGDLDGAEERLGLVETNDAELAVRIGELRGSIKERRRLAADERAGGDDGAGDELPDIEPATPPPSWVLPAGIALTATGIAGAVTVAIKRTNDKRNLALYDAELAASGCSVSARDCNPDNLSTELANVYDTGVRQLRAANTANVTIGVLSGVSFAAGTGLIIYHLVRSAGANSAAAEQAPEAMLVPAVGPDFTGATLHLRF